MWQIKCIIVLFAVNLGASYDSSALRKVFVPTLRGRFTSYACIAHCLHQNMEPASIESAQENDAAIAAMKKSGVFNENVWISGYFENNYKQWFWTMNRHPFTYTNWYSARPVNNYENRCLTFVAGDGRWFDYRCESRFYCLCQVPTDGPLVSPNSAVANTEPIVNKLFLVKVFKLNWNDAKYSCSNNNMKLASIETAEENEAAIAAMEKAGVYGENVWISASKIEDKEEWTWVSGNNFSSYQNWLPGQPDNTGGSENCARYRANTGKWADMTCSEKSTYLCEIPTGDHVLIPKRTHSFSSNSLNPFPVYERPATVQKQYMLITNNKQTWKEAFEMCAQSGLRLASIESPQENQAVSVILKNVGKGDEYVWTSGTKRNNQWIWAVSGNLMTYTNWANNQPDNWNGNEDCVHYNAGKGIWNDIHCDNRFLFICEKLDGGSSSPSGQDDYPNPNIDNFYGGSGSGNGTWGYWFTVEQRRKAMLRNQNVVDESQQ